MSNPNPNLEAPRHAFAARLHNRLEDFETLIEQGVKARHAALQAGWPTIEAASIALRRIDHPLAPALRKRPIDPDEPTHITRAQHRNNVEGFTHYIRDRRERTHKVDTTLYGIPDLRQLEEEARQIRALADAQRAREYREAAVGVRAA